MNTSTKICISTLIISALLLFAMLLLAIPYEDYNPKATQTVTAEKVGNSGDIKPTDNGQAICPNLGEN